MQIKIITAILLSFLIHNLFSVEPVKKDTFFTNDEIKKVNDGQIITRMFLKNNVTNENTDLQIKIPSTQYVNEDFTVYEMITDEKAFIPFKITDEASKLSFYNTLTAYSKLSGMKYFSRRIQKIQELIVNTYRIESPKKKSKLEDIEYQKIEPKVINYFLQEDNKFGKLVYESVLYNEGNNFILINTCQQPISKFIFNICKKEEYKLFSYFIYDEKAEGFYYYTVNIMRIRLDFVLTENDVMVLYPTTFSNRLRAATVHLAQLLDLKWEEKINPWDEKKLRKGLYKNY